MTMAHQIPDRVPINYISNPGIDAKLKQAYNLSAEDDEGLRQRLGVDFRGVGAPYIGPPLHPPRENRIVDPQMGYILRWVENDSGGYHDYCDFPLTDADYEQVAAWPLPDPDAFDYSRLEADCEFYKDYALYVGGAGLACIMNTAGFLRGMEQMFVDLISDDEAGLLLIDRFLDVQLKVTERVLDKVGKHIDFMWIGEDLGTQHTPLIGMDILKKHLLPRQKPFFDLAKSHGLYVMMHTCGSSSWAYPEYIKLGLNGVDTLQPEAAFMSPSYLKQTFGDQLFFHGCISTAGPVAYGTVEDTIKDVRDTLEVMMPGGGYCLCPTHQLQDNSPLENVLAMYETAHKYGRY